MSHPLPSAVHPAAPMRRNHPMAWAIAVATGQHGGPGQPGAAGVQPGLVRRAGAAQWQRGTEWPDAQRCADPVPVAGPAAGCSTAEAAAVDRQPRYGCAGDCPAAAPAGTGAAGAPRGWLHRCRWHGQGWPERRPEPADPRLAQCARRNPVAGQRRAGAGYGRADRGQGDPELGDLQYRRQHHAELPAEP